LNDEDEDHENDGYPERAHVIDEVTHLYHRFVEDLVVCAWVPFFTQMHQYIILASFHDVVKEEEGNDG